MQPPSGVVAYYSIGLGAILLVLWIASERRRFKGPPTGDVIAQRKAEIAASETAIDSAMKVRRNRARPGSTLRAINLRVVRRLKSL
jgi:hypothetical protein